MGSIIELLKPQKGKDPLSQTLLDAAVLNNRVFWLMLISQSPLPAGSFEQGLIGTQILANNEYVLLYRNPQTAPVGVAIYAAFTSAAGRQIKLALRPDNGDVTVVDYLGNTPNPPSFNKRISATTVLKPGESLYANCADINFPWAVGDVLKVRVFDPLTYLADSSWESKR